MARQTRLKQWQQFSYQPYQFNHIAEFGVPVSSENPLTGINEPEFKQIAKLHYARRNQTVSDRYQAAGTTYEDTTLIVIRHNKDIASRDVLYVKIDGKLYSVISYSVNNDSYNSADLLTLKHVKKVS